jgi:Zn-dependent protease with chaperone function
MFAARGAGVSLAVFVVVYAICSMAVFIAWRVVLRASKPASARYAADLLCALRIFPLGAAFLVMLGIALPSFLLLEPRSTDEAVGAAPTALAIGCLAIVLLGLVRALRAQRRTSRAMERWLNGSVRIESPDSVPVFRSSRNSPTLTVAGVCAPKVIISDDAASVLTPTELRTALRHEIAHVRRYDNLKKLVFRLAVFPGNAPLEAAWAEQTELAADDAAVSNVGDALDLASALIKVSRLAATPNPELSTALLHSSTALTTRINRLFAWRETKIDGHRAFSWSYAVPVMAAVGCLLLTYGSLLRGMHQVTEWLVR